MTTKKLTSAQVDVLNNGERNTSAPGRVWMSPWNDKTMGILKEQGLIEWRADLSRDEKEAEARLLDSLADKIKTAVANQKWGLATEFAHDVIQASRKMTSQSYYLTEAGRQALIAAKGGA